MKHKQIGENIASISHGVTSTISCKEYKCKKKKKMKIQSSISQYNIMRLPATPIIGRNKIDIFCFLPIKVQLFT